jgi:ATP-dependent DNA helicase PIF1
METNTITEEQQIAYSALLSEKQKADVILTEEQQKAYDTLLTGKNCFITGDAGVGKSFVLNKYIEDMKKINKNVIVTSPTGVAASNIGGTTIHRAFGYPTSPVIVEDKINIDDIEITDTKNQDNKAYNIYSIRKCFSVADIIVIDEISMVRIDLFDLFCFQLKCIENRTEGRHIQIIISGDFNQLPPVMTDKDRKILSQRYPNLGSGFAFQSQNWSKLNLHNIFLHEIIRQSDALFIQANKCLKEGNMNIIPWFNRNIVNRWDNETLVLCPTNAEARSINENRLNNIDSEEYIYTEYIEGDKIDDSDRHNDPVVKLKVGARVMSIVNDKESRYANGNIGIIIEISDKMFHTVKVRFDNGNTCDIDYYDWPIYDYDVVDGRVVAKQVSTISQIPLKLAYAITIHKCQGQTYDRVAIKPDSIFSYGQLYVAMTRCKSLSGIQLVSDIPERVKVHSEKYNKDFTFPIKLADKNVIMFYQGLKEE